MKKLTLFIACMLLFSWTTWSQEEQNEKMTSSQPSDAVFPMGQKGPASFFTGNAYNYGLVKPDSTFTTLAGNVFFEPGARSNWHLHPAGQILIVIDGKGYHQIKGQPRETIKKGDVIQCPPNKVHWHGASEDSSMTHIYVIPNIEKGIVEWMDPVTDEQYSNKQ